MRRLRGCGLPEMIARWLRSLALSGAGKIFYFGSKRNFSLFSCNSVLQVFEGARAKNPDFAMETRLRL
jgi:hypothetical protein